MTKLLFLEQVANFGEQFFLIGGFRSRSRSGFLLFLTESGNLVDTLDHQEDTEGHNEEVNGHLDEVTIVPGHRVHQFLHGLGKAVFTHNRFHNLALRERQAQFGDESEVGNLLADVNITNIAASSESTSYKDKNGRTYVDTKFKGEVDVTITLTDVGTEEVIGSPSFSTSGTSSSTNASQEQAFKNGIGYLANRISTWLNQTLPLQANIIEGNAVKKDKQKTVYIDLGSREGAFAGIHMGVFIVKTIAGREARQQIGKLKVETVLGDDISLCKVQSGGKEIKKAIEAGEQLLVISL